MNIHFLHHSGFMVDDETRCYIFDYYQDPTGLVQAAADEGCELWFFVTHIHHDHYAPVIKNFEGAKTRYIVHDDVPLTGVAQLTKMKPGEALTLDTVSIRMFGSTDEGGSFLIDNGSESFFHAGDLNWWHWWGDTPENIRYAHDFAWQEFAPLAGVNVDYAMFPVDARLEYAREWGVIEFLRLVTVRKALIPMHANGPVWEPSPYFKALFRDTPLIIPTEDGEELVHHV